MVSIKLINTKINSEQRKKKEKKETNVVHLYSPLIALYEIQSTQFPTGHLNGKQNVALSNLILV